jgi:Ankyrin repeats (3 copies)/Ankyrin repeat
MRTAGVNGEEATMPTRQLPNNPNLDRLRGQAKTLLRQARAGEAKALATVAEFHPHAPPQLALSDAQLVLARQYGFPSWPRLRDHVEAVRYYSRSPHSQPIGTGGSGPDEFLRLACLNYGQDDDTRMEAARRMLAEHPDLSAATIHTAAAVGDVAAARAMLTAEPTLARLEGGPFRWEPLLYAAYSRLDSTQPGHSTLEVARLLLDHGADPNAGYLWDGLPSPFTALTGAFGRGEQNGPPHQYRDQLARLLLDRGADPNDSQTMYNLGPGCWPVADTSHLEILFAYGLGKGPGGPWRERIGLGMLSPEELVHEELMYAAKTNLPDRARIVIAHGVDVDRRSTGHPMFGGVTPLELAVAMGNQEMVRVLEEAGARPVTDELAYFVGACLRGDEAEAERRLAADPSLLERARQRVPDLLLHAAESGRPAAVRLLIRLGQEVDDLSCLGRTPLHVAAFAGDRATVDALLGLGADPSIADREHDSTPAGWAAYAGHRELADYLQVAEAKRREGQ